MNSGFQLYDLLRQRAPLPEDAPFFASLEEGQFFERKSGAMLADEKKGTSEIREAVAALANSEGGILLIGQTDEKVVDGVPLLVGEQLSAQWVASVIKTIDFLLPAPLIYPYELLGRQLIVVVVHRTSHLVSTLVKGQRVYFFRIEDQNVRAPSYLALDLLHGRRRGPRFRVVPVGAMMHPFPDGLETPGIRIPKHLKLMFRFEVTNVGFEWGDQCTFGSVHYSYGQPDRVFAPEFYERAEVLPLEGRNANFGDDLRLTIDSRPAEPDAKPFKRIEIPVDVGIPPEESLSCSGAFFAYARNQDPQWFQWQWTGTPAQLLKNSIAQKDAGNNPKILKIDNPTIEPALRPAVHFSLD